MKQAVLVCWVCHKALQTGWLKQHRFISHSSELWKSKVKVLADSCPGKNSPAGLQMAAFSLCPHMVERGSSLVFLFIRTLITLVFNSNLLNLTLITSLLWIQSNWGLGLQNMNLEGEGNLVHRPGTCCPQERERERERWRGNPQQRMLRRKLSFLFWNQFYPWEYYTSYHTKQCPACKRGCSSQPPALSSPVRNQASVCMFKSDIQTQVFLSALWLYLLSGTEVGSWILGFCRDLAWI